MKRGGVESLWQLDSQQNFAKFYLDTQLENTPNFYTLHTEPYTNKLSIILLAQKLLIKWWWNWPQFLFLSLLHMDMMHFRINRFEEKTYQLNWFEEKKQSSNKETLQAFPIV